MADKNCSMCGGKGYYCEFSTLETCWCVEPATKADEASDLRTEVAKLKRLIAERWKPEVERLRTRLEIDERTPYDGIACRDETIKGLDEKCDRLKAEVERLRKVEALQKQVNEHYKRWYRECIDEPFDTWLKDDATHWIGEQDAAFQAWQYLHENKIWLMKERIEEHEQERDRLKAENEALRQFAAEAYQVLGALDAPENVLDNASDAANGAPLRHETLLPFFAEDYEALRKDAERYRWLRVQPNDCTAPRIDVVRWEPMDESANEGEGLRFEALDAAIDAALEGGGR